MQVDLVQNLCEQLARSFSSRNYEIDFHVHEGGAAGVCAHLDDSSCRIAIRSDESVAVAFVGEIFNVEEIAHKTSKYQLTQQI